MSLLRRRLSDGERLDLDGAVLRLRVNSRARRISLRFNPLTGETIVTAPTPGRLADAVAFAGSRRAWIAQRLLARPPVQSLAATTSIQILGAECLLIPDGRRPRLIGADEGSPARIAGCGIGAVDAQLVVRAVKAEALGVFRRRASAHCLALGAPAPSIALIDARTRWGSCTPAQGGRPASIRLSWRLALAPYAVADYVVAHECAHLLEANHGPRFWAHVRGLVGEHGAHRAWLRDNGAALHAFAAAA